MNKIACRVLIGWLVVGTSALASANPQTTMKPSVVPAGLDFVRGLDIEAYVQDRSYNQTGAQSLRLETRYLDPDVNAFVGMLTQINQFNEVLQVGDPNSPTTSSWMENWGGDFGIVRGKHLWELDLMGSSLASRLAFAPGIVGEHQLGHGWSLYHRSVLNLYAGDTILDSDQGVRWMPWTNITFSLGYRMLDSSHMNRNGPRIGVMYHFQSPKIPFLFPSMG